jgi:colicin import membrane protein
VADAAQELEEQRRLQERQRLAMVAALVSEGFNTEEAEEAIKHVGLDQASASSYIKLQRQKRQEAEARRLAAEAEAKRLVEVEQDRKRAVREQEEADQRYVQQLQREDEEAEKAAAAETRQRAADATREAEEQRRLEERQRLAEEEEAKRLAEERRQREAEAIGSSRSITTLALARNDLGKLSTEAMQALAEAKTNYWRSDCNFWKSVGMVPLF